MGLYGIQLLFSSLLSNLTTGLSVALYFASALIMACIYFLIFVAVFIFWKRKDQSTTAIYERKDYGFIVYIALWGFKVIAMGISILIILPFLGNGLRDTSINIAAFTLLSGILSFFKYVPSKTYSNVFTVMRVNGYML